VSHQRPGLWDHKPLLTLALRDSVQPDLSHTCDRLIPGLAREASGSLARLPDPGRPVSISKAVWRVSLAETARARLCARMVNALPWPCVFSPRATSVCPAGLLRRHKPAASEQAHVRWPLPILVPDVPHRLPAAALAHVTRRP